MADKAIGELPAATAIYDDSLFVAEQQGKAVKITGRQLRSIAGTGSTGGGTSGGGDTSGSGGASWGFIEMETSIPVANRFDNTLYGLIMQEYGG